MLELKLSLDKILERTKVRLLVIREIILFTISLISSKLNFRIAIVILRNLLRFGDNKLSKTYNTPITNFEIKKKVNNLDKLLDKAKIEFELRAKQREAIVSYSDTDFLRDLETVTQAYRVNKGYVSLDKLSKRKCKIINLK